MFEIYKSNMSAGLVSCEELLKLINNKEKIIIFDCHYVPGTDYISKYKT